MSKILIIEDDTLVSNIYRNNMVLEGHQVECAPDGEQGLERLEGFEPDSVLLDLMLPGMSGVEVLKHIRSDPARSTLPVVVLSNTYLSSMIQAAWQAGASRCLSKASSTPKSVTEVIESLLKADVVRGQPVLTVQQPAADGPSEEALVSDFNANMPSTLNRIRALHSALVKAADDVQRLTALMELLQCTREVTGAAGMVGYTHLAQMSEVLEALIQELHEKPKNINPSTLRTLASGIDLMATLAKRGTKVPARNGTAKVLVVDDDALSRRAVTYSLEKARLGSTAVDSPDAALDLLSKQTYDLVVLDIEMPEVNGFEVCSRLRGFAANKQTPVVFVTALNNFENRANSTMSGGNDFIGKPFLFIELAAKALVHIWRSKLQPVN